MNDVYREGLVTREEHEALVKQTAELAERIARLERQVERQRPLTGEEFIGYFGKTWKTWIALAVGMIAAGIAMQAILHTAR